MAGLDGDKIVALLGLVLALAFVSQSTALRTMPLKKRFVYGAIWGVLIAVLALAANWSGSGL